MTSKHMYIYNMHAEASLVKLGPTYANHAAVLADLYNDAVADGLRREVDYRNVTYLKSKNLRTKLLHILYGKYLM